MLRLRVCRTLNTGLSTCSHNELVKIERRSQQTSHPSVIFVTVNISHMTHAHGFIVGKIYLGLYWASRGSLLSTLHGPLVTRILTVAHIHLHLA